MFFNNVFSQYSKLSSSRHPSEADTSLRKTQNLNPSVSALERVHYTTKVQQYQCIHVLAFIFQNFNYGKGHITRYNFSCNLSRNVVARQVARTIHRVTCCAMVKIVARQVAPIVAQSRIRFYFLQLLQQFFSALHRNTLSATCLAMFP